MLDLAPLQDRDSGLLQVGSFCILAPHRCCPSPPDPGHHLSTSSCCSHLLPPLPGAVRGEDACSSGTRAVPAQRSSSSPVPAGSAAPTWRCYLAQQEARTLWSYLGVPSAFTSPCLTALIRDWCCTRAKTHSTVSAAPPPPTKVWYPMEAQIRLLSHS